MRLALPLDPDLAGAVAVFERDAEWVPYLAALEEEIYRGRDVIERMWREVLRDLPDFRIEFVQVVADCHDLVPPDAMLLRQFAQNLGFSQSFTVLDREDARDLMSSCIAERKISKERRFPRAEVVLDLVSTAINLQRSLAQVLHELGSFWPDGRDLNPSIDYEDPSHLVLDDWR